MGSCQSTDASVGAPKAHPSTPPPRASGSKPVNQEAPALNHAPKRTPAPAVGSDASIDTNKTGLSSGGGTSSGGVALDQNGVDWIENHEDPGYSSGGSTPTPSLDGSRHGLEGKSEFALKAAANSSSVLGLDTMIESRREAGDLKTNVVHIEVPFGKPIEEVYDGVHDGPVLGSGISGLVRLVTHKATKMKYAVKCLDLDLVESEEGLQQLREEIYIMCQLDHPNIVRLEEVYESHTEIYLVQELCLGGELFDRLDEQPDYHYTEAQCARLVKQMLSSVRYLHSKGIIHRDLKLENFLFSSTNPDSELKMIDFGLSKHFKYGEVHHDAVGTPYTVAPEVIRGSYDERCDIWAIGVITYLLLSGDPPFGGCGGPEPLMTVRSNILRGSFVFEPADVWADVSPQARNFICTLLVTNPNNRPTAREAQRHRWLREWASRNQKGVDNKLNPNVIKALVSFKEFSDMRKLLCEVLSFTLLPEQIQDLRKEFEKMDTDGSGEISLTALKQVLIENAGAGSLGALTEDEVVDIFNAMRVRKTETRIHWHEFIAAGLSQCKVDDRNLRLAFDRLDSDHKGYITFENVMDLLGSDAESHSEDSLRRMWGDSMKACNLKFARITYEDFLLLMKGQTKDGIEPELEKKVPDDSILLSGSTMGLSVVQEGRPATQEILPASGLSVLQEGLPVVQEGIPMLESTYGESKQVPKIPAEKNAEQMATENGGSGAVARKDETNHLLGSDNPTAPPAEMDNLRNQSVHSQNMGMFETSVDDDAPLSMDDEEVPGGILTSSSFGDASDYTRAYSMPVVFEKNNGSESLDIPPAGKYFRRRSRSVDDQDPEFNMQDEDDDKPSLAFEVDSRRAMLLPESTHQKDPAPASVIGTLLKDESKSPLVINRQLYRTHRKMRIAVLEASKRFEEEQTRRASEILRAKAAAPLANSMSRGGAGLVMRRGFNNTDDQEAVSNFLRRNQEEQKCLMEKANRRGGRGRRTRKKTISDMTAMLSSPLPSDDLLGNSSFSALADDKPKEIISPNLDPLENETKTDSSDRSLGVRTTMDPFKKMHLYGVGDFGDLNFSERSGNTQERMKTSHSDGRLDRAGEPPSPMPVVETSNITVTETIELPNLE